MIVSVCADKGAPGVTTLATALGLVWPTRRLVLEADVAGATLPLRLQLRLPLQAGGRLLDPEPSVLTVATHLRSGQLRYDFGDYTQPAALGFPVMPGGQSAEAFAGVSGWWPQIAAVARDWPGVVLADLGRFQPGSAAAPVAAASTAVLLLARPDLEGLYGMRERALELTSTLGRPDLERSPVAVVVRGCSGRSGAEAKSAVERARAVLEAEGSPVPVLGAFADDRAAVEGLRGQQVSRKLLGTDLVSSARRLVEALVVHWPELGTAVGPEESLEVTGGGPVSSGVSVATSSPSPVEQARAPWGRLAALREQAGSAQVPA